MKIDPHNDLKEVLLSVKMPGRYTGGEWGSLLKEKAQLRIALCFPDLYEVGMSNLAIKILYEMLNGIEGVACERVFAPAHDFEEALRSRGIPLYTLESGTPLHECDLVLFSIGYELAATNILTVLERGGIPLYSRERGGESPLILAGGPAFTNPAPLGPFLDGVYLGEAENEFRDLVIQARDLKSQGAGRSDLLQLFQISPAFWFEGKQEPTLRSLNGAFPDANPYKSRLVPSIATVQDHGVVEIMRGCPNGCRFCHAGILYRPQREKSVAAVMEEADWLIRHCGYRQITLASLSTGDYSQIAPLLKSLNQRYAHRNISFSFPSIRINSFTLPMLKELSAVRKSGLTFAVETPNLNAQRGLNKEVPLERSIGILKEAAQAGWNQAKFYFMLGLPVSEWYRDAQRIIEFALAVKTATGMKLNLNIGTFVPKPHTPFQWAPQLSEEESLRQIQEIRAGLRGKGVKTGYHSPFASYLEGIIARGDSRVSAIIMEAWKRGARLDGWEEHLQRDLWKGVLQEVSDWDVQTETLRQRGKEESFPWDGISLGTSREYLWRENQKAAEALLTSPCTAPCGHPCGVCGPAKPSVQAAPAADSPAPEGDGAERETAVKGGGEKTKMLISFSKTGRALYLSHINTMTIFERALLRAELPLVYTEGFNPKPKMEFANPLPLGISGEAEAVSFELGQRCQPEPLLEALDASLPEGFSVHRAAAIPLLQSRETGKKSPSLMSLFAGAEYRISLSRISEGDKERAVNRLTAFLEDSRERWGDAFRYQTSAENLFHVSIRLNGKGKMPNLLKEMRSYFSSLSDPVGGKGDDDALVNRFDIVRQAVLAGKGNGEGESSYFDFFSPSCTDSRDESGTQTGEAGL